MSARLGSRQLLRETVPVAVIMLFWGILSAFLPETVAAGVRYASVVMVLLYVIVRGIQLAGTHTFTGHPDDLAGLLRENGRVALIASVWFLAAFLASITFSPAATLPLAAAYPVAVETLSRALLAVLEILEFAFTGTGVATVILYAVAAGLHRSSSHTSEAGNSGSVDTRAYD